MYIHNFLQFERAVVTSGHCICGLYTVASSDRDPGMSCKEATASVLTPDQITHDNRISVDGGSKNVQNPNLRMWFVMEKAMVKYDEKNYVRTNKKDYDIGVATGPSAFNPQTSQLMNQNVFYTTPTSIIGPICLGKETDDLPQCHLTTVGWGKT